MKKILYLVLMMLISSCVDEVNYFSVYECDAYSERVSESAFGFPMSGDNYGTGWGELKVTATIIQLDLEKRTITFKGSIEEEFIILNADEIKETYGKNWDAGFLIIRMKVMDKENNSIADFEMIPSGEDMQFYLTYTSEVYCFNAKYMTKNNN